MFDLELSVFLSNNNFNRIANMDIEGDKSDFIIDIDIIDEPLHIMYRKENDKETLDFFNRKMIRDYLHPFYSIEIQSLDDFYQFSDSTREFFQLCYKAASNLNIILTQEVDLGELEADVDFQMAGGIEISLKDGLITFDILYDLDRPDLLCIKKDDTCDYGRPYDDEIYENEDVFDLPHLIKRGHMNLEETICDQMMSSLIKEDYTKALEYANQLDEDDLAGLFIKAILYIKDKEIDKAIELLEPIKDEESILEELYCLLSNLQLSVSNANQSLENLSTHTNHLLNLEMFMMKYFNIFDETEIINNSQILIQNNNPVGYNYLGICFMQQGNDQKAIETFECGIRHNEPTSMMSLAHYSIQKGQKEKGIELLYRAKDVGLNEANRYLGFYYVKEFDIENAKKYFKEFLKHEDDEELEEYMKLL